MRRFGAEPALGRDRLAQFIGLARKAIVEPRLAHARGRTITRNRHIVGYATRAPNGDNHRKNVETKYELATKKGGGSRIEWVWDAKPGTHQSTAKWKLKEIKKHRDGAHVYFTKGGRDSPPINVTDISDIALSAAQLDRRVRFAGGARAGPTLVTIIKAHLARRA